MVVTTNILERTFHVRFKNNFGTGVILLDGHNNPGFSGGPVVRANSSSSQPVVIGVVTAHEYYSAL